MDIGLWAFLPLLLLAGCASGNFLNQNDRLRAENLELRERVAELSQRVATLEQRLEITKQRDQNRRPLPKGLYPPIATHLVIGSYSGGINTDQDHADDAIRLYLRTEGGRGRFVQTVATARATVAAIPPGEPAHTVATAHFSARAFDQAYRSGITGTHYTLTIPIDPDAVPRNAQQLTVRVALTDLLTGRTLQAEKTLPWSAD